MAEVEGLVPLTGRDGSTPFSRTHGNPAPAGFRAVEENQSRSRPALPWFARSLPGTPVEHPGRFLESPTVKLAIALAVLAIVALLWIASEEHYQGCVGAAEATTVAPETEADANPWKAVDDASGAERAAAVAGCSRLP